MDPTQTDGREGFRVDLGDPSLQQTPQAPASPPPPSLDAEWDAAMASVKSSTPEAQAAKASVASHGTLRNLWDSVGSGVINAGLETKDFIVGETPEAEKWPFRRYLEAKGRALVDQGPAYGITQGISQFTAGLIGAGKLVEGVKVVSSGTKLAAAVGKAGEAISSTTAGKATLGFAKNSATPMAVGAIAFDPHQERLGNLLEAVPELQGTILTYTAARPDDSAALGRFKAAVESLGFDAAVATSLGLGLKAWKALRGGDAKSASEALSNLEKHEASVEVRSQAPVVEPPPVRATVADPLVVDPVAPPAANENKALVSSANDNVTSATGLNQDLTGNPLGTSERSPLSSGNPDTSATVPGEPANANFPQTPAVAQDNVDPWGTSTTRIDLKPQTETLQAPQPKTFGDFFESSTKPKVMAEATGAPGGVRSESVSEAAPTITAVDKAPRSGSKKVEPLAPVEATPEEAAAIFKRLPEDMAALKTYGSRIEAEAAGYKFSQGSIPWQKLNSPDELQAFLGNVSDALRPVMDHAKGGAAQSDEYVMRVANQWVNAYGGNPKEVLGALVKLGDDARTMASKMEAADAIGTKMIDEAYQVAAKIQRGNLSDWGGDAVAAMAEFTKRVGLSVTVEGAARSMLSNSGRTLRRARGDLDRLTFDEVKKISTLDPETVLRLFQTSGGNVVKLKELVGKDAGFWRKASDVGGFLLANNLLWGWATHAANFMGNGAMLALRPTEKMIGGTVQHFLGIDVPGSSAVVRQANLELRSLRTTVADSFNEAANAFTKYESIMDPHMVEASRMAAAERPSFRPIENLGDLVYNGLAGAYHAVGLPTRALGAADELFKQMRYRSVVIAKARQAAEDAGLVGDAASDYIRRSLSDAFDANGVAVDTVALKEARTSTFQNELLRSGSEDTYGGFASMGAGLQDLTSNVPMLRLIFPFVKTPANVLRMGIKYTPGINLLQKEYQNALRGVHGTEAQAQAIGQLAIGSLASMTIAVAALDGRITGGGPNDPKVRNELLATGWRPYSIVMRNDDGTASYFQFNRFDPLALPLGIIADMVDVYQHPGRFKDAGDGWYTHMALAMAKNVSDKTYLRSLQGVTQALSDPEKSGSKYLANLLGNMVPFASATKNYVNDEHMREVRHLTDGIMNATPGLSDSLPVVRDAWGNPITVRRGFHSSTTDNIVDNEMVRLGIDAGHAITAPSPHHNGVDLRDVTLEDGTNAYERFQVLSGHPKGAPSLKDAVAELISRSDYPPMADGDGITKGTKTAAIRVLVGKYREAALKALQSESPTVRDKLHAAEEKARAAIAAGKKDSQAAGDAARLRSFLDSYGIQIPQGQ